MQWRIHNISGGPYQVVDPVFRPNGGNQFNNLSVCHVNFFVGGVKVCSRTGWGGHDRICPPASVTDDM